LIGNNSIFPNRGIDMYMTAIRGLLNGQLDSSYVWWALGWCLVILASSYIWSQWLFQRKTGRR